MTSALALRLRALGRSFFGFRAEFARPVKRRNQLSFEHLEARKLLAIDIAMVDYFDTWDGGLIRSTDVAGLTYHTPSGHLYLADSEINEIPGVFNGDNIFEVAPAGDQVFQEIQSNNDEPTGIAYSEFDGFFYVSNDVSGGSVSRYDSNLNNPLATIRPSDDVSGAKDAEGITADPSTGNIYVADGTSGGRQVLAYDSNLDFLYSFSVANRVQDPEGIALDPISGNLFIMSGPDMAIYEYTLTGSYVNEYDISGFSPDPVAPQGLAFGPTSNPNDDPSALAIYIADAMVDNVEDGRVYEAILIGNSPNQAPSVDAGSNQTIQVTETANLNGTVSDDSLPNPPANVTTTWSEVSGPGTVTFGNVSAVDTTAMFSSAGTYVLRLTANDSQLTANDDVTITVNDSGGGGTPVTATFRQGANGYSGANDAWIEAASSTTNHGSAVRLRADGDPDRAVLMRWDTSSIAAGSQVTSASITLNVTGQSNISYEIYELLRNWGEDEVTWQNASNGSAWQTGGAQGSADVSSTILGQISASSQGSRTINLNSAGIAAVQSWINNPSNNRGLMVADYVQGSDGLSFDSKEDSLTSNRPLLSITYNGQGGQQNQAPSVDAGSNQTIQVTETANLNGTVSDDSLPNPPANVTTTWSEVSGPGTVTFGNVSAVDTTAMFSSAGTYVLRLTANDSQLTANDDVTITVNDSGGGGTPVTATFRQGANGYSGANDAWIEAASSTTNHGSEVRLRADGYPDRAVLMRWDTSSIAAGSQVTSASITLNVTGQSNISYEIYELLRNWGEDEVTWQNASNGSAWQTGGAQGSADVSSTVLGQISASSQGSRTINLNSAGIAAVQSWINNPSNNRGLMVADYVQGSDGLSFDSKEDSLTSNRPLLSITYNGQGGQQNQAPSANAGSNQTIQVTETANLNGTVSDDSLPNPPANVTTTWSEVSGPGTVTFGNVSAVDTTAMFSSAGTYVLRLTANDSQLTANDDVTITVNDSGGGGTPVTATFRQGANGYSGANDAWIEAASSTTNHGSAVRLRADGDPDRAVLMRWDTSSIAAGSQVTSASITLNVTGQSNISYEIYELLRNWGEDEVTWQNASNGSAWQTGGAQGSADVSSTVLGQISASSQGSRTINLNSAGIAAVQSWINNPSNNRGLMVADYVQGSDGLSFDSKEDSLTSNRPLLSITYNGQGGQQNQAPSVNAGSNQTIQVTETANLNGTVSDDGLPNPPANVTTTWSEVSGPGTVTFGNVSAVDTTAMFSSAGTYVLRLTANDSQLTANDDVTITVNDSGGGGTPVTATFRQGANGYSGANDAWIEAASSTTNHGSEVRLRADGYPDRAVLMRWDTSSIAAGSQVTSASITLNVTGQSNISYEIYELLRNWGEDEVTWQNASNGSAWQTGGAQGSADVSSTVLGQISASSQGSRTINLNSAGIAAVQSWINNPSNNRGLMVADYVQGSDGLSFDSKEDSLTSNRPLLSITYNGQGGQQNQAPSVNAGSNQTIQVTETANLNGTVSDDGLPNPPANVTTTWSEVSGPGTVTFGNVSAVDTTAMFSSAGTYVLRLTANDSQLTANDDVTITVNDSGGGGTPVTATFRQGANGYSGANDAWIEAASSTTNHGSEVRLRADGYPDRAVLMRWDTSSIAAGSQVTSASITLNVTGQSNISYEIYELLRNWGEDEVTWQNASNGSAWQTGGAQGSADVSSTVLGQISASSQGSRTINLNSAGIAAVQSWINNPSNNRGLMVADYVQGSDGLSFDSKEDSLTSNRPLLSITYGGTPSVGGTYQVASTVETEADQSKPGDPAIWIHPTDSSLSTIIGIDKGGAPGLHVYDLAGNAIQTIGNSQVKNVDLRYNFSLDGESVDLVSASWSAGDTIAIYMVDPATRQLVDVAASQVETGLVPVRGISMYVSPVTGKHYVFVDSRNGEVEQYELFDNGNGEVDATLVRTFDVGTTVQGVVTDDVHGVLYISEEDVGIWKYGAEPSAGTTRTMVDTTDPGGHLTADVEGVSIYYASDGTGYLIASSQGSSEFVMYRREGNNEYVATFEIVAGNGLDEVTNTDGIDVTNAPLGPTFPNGVFIAHDNDVNFKLVPWDAIASAIGPEITVDTSWDPRAVGS